MTSDAFFTGDEEYVRLSSPEVPAIDPRVPEAFDDAAAEVKLIGVREAARRLGVHENTVRNWGSSGLLRPAAQLRGSGYRRYDPDEVEALRRWQIAKHARNENAAREIARVLSVTEDEIRQVRVAAEEKIRRLRAAADARVREILATQKGK